jgi:hypothetical protein
MSGSGLDTDPIQEKAAEVLAEQLAADGVPLIRAIRAIRAQPHVGQPRAQRLREYLAAGAERHRQNSPRSGTIGLLDATCSLSDA